MAIYMHYDGIDGAVTEEGHSKWIELGSLQWGVGRGVSSPVGSTMDREASAPSISEVTVAKTLDKASPKILQEALQGEGKTVKIDFTRTEKGKLEVFLALKLENTMISGFSMSSGGDRPTESLSLNFTKIEYKFTSMEATGKAGSPETVIYDLSTAKAG